jgi:hypothetical protein
MSPQNKMDPSTHAAASATVAKGRQTGHLCLGTLAQGTLCNILNEQVSRPPHEQDRNANHTTADWHFTTANARIKLKHL